MSSTDQAAPSAVSSTAVPLAPVAASTVVTASAVLVAAAAGLLLGVLCAFLVPFRIGGALIPICFVLVAVGAVGTVRFAHRVTGRIAAAAAPTITWFVTMMVFAARTAEGDLVVTDSWVGVGVLFFGSIAFAVAVFLEISARIPQPQPMPDATDRAETVTGLPPHGTM